MFHIHVSWLDSNAMMNTMAKNNVEKVYSIL